MFLVHPIAPGGSGNQLQRAPKTLSREVRCSSPSAPTGVVGERGGRGRETAENADTRRKVPGEWGVEPCDVGLAPGPGSPTPRHLVCRPTCPPSMPQLALMCASDTILLVGSPTRGSEEGRKNEANTRSPAQRARSLPKSGESKRDRGRPLHASRQDTRGRFRAGMLDRGAAG